MGSLGPWLRASPAAVVGGKGWRDPAGRKRSVCLPFGPHRPQKIGTWPRRKAVLAGAAGPSTHADGRPLALQTPVIPVRPGCLIRKPWPLPRRSLPGRCGRDLARIGPGIPCLGGQLTRSRSRASSRPFLIHPFPDPSLPLTKAHAPSPSEKPPTSSAFKPRSPARQGSGKSGQSQRDPLAHGPSPAG